MLYEVITRRQTLPGADEIQRPLLQPDRRRRESKALRRRVLRQRPAQIESATVAAQAVLTQL